MSRPKSPESTTPLSFLMDRAATPMCTILKSGRFAYANQAFLDRFQYTWDELKAVKVQDCFPDDERKAATGHLRDARRADDARCFQQRIRCGDGSWRVAEWHTLATEHGRLTALLRIHAPRNRSQTDRDRMQHLERLADRYDAFAACSRYLQESESEDEIFRVLESTLPMVFPGSAGTLLLNKSGPMDAEPALSWASSDVTTAGLLATAHCAQLHAHDRQLGMLSITEPGATAQGPTRDPLVGAIADQIALTLTNLRLRDELARIAVRDPLTNLFNRKYLEETGARETARARRGNKPLTMLLLAVDGFADYRETQGHGAADAVATSLAEKLSPLFRRSDVVCRFDESTFAVLMPDASMAIGERRAHDVQEACRMLQPPGWTPHTGPFKMSVGMACTWSGAEPFAALLDASQRALRRAQTEGGGRVVAAPSEPAPA